MSTSCLNLGFRFNSARRAYTCARSAVNASIRIDDVNVALADRADRALADAGATCDTRIMNYICHSILLQQIHSNDSQGCHKIIIVIPFAGVKNQRLRPRRRDLAFARPFWA